MFHVTQDFAPRLAFGGAFLLIGSAAALGAFYGFQLGAHYHPAIGLFFALAALGGAILAPFAVDDAIRSLQRLAIVRTVVCTLFAVVAVAYSSAAALSLANGTRGDLAASRKIAVDRISSLSAVRDKAISELKAIAPARSAAELAPQIRNLKAQPGANGCKRINGPVSRRVCAKVASLEAELGRAQRREKLQRDIANTTGQIATTAGVGSSDPLANAVSVYAAALGWKWSPGQILPWLALIPVAFLELGAALSVFVARTVPDTQKGQNSRVRTPTGQETAFQEGAFEKIPSETPKNIKTVVPALKHLITFRTVRGRPTLNKIIEKLKSRGGIFEGSTRDLAKQLKLGKSTVHRATQDLASAGLIRAEASKKGMKLMVI